MGAQFESKCAQLRLGCASSEIDERGGNLCSTINEIYVYNEGTRWPPPLLALQP